MRQRQPWVMVIAGLLAVIAASCSTAGSTDDPDSAANRAVCGATSATATAEVAVEGDPVSDQDIAAASARRPFDVDALDVSLQVDRTRVSLGVVSEQFRVRVATNPDDHLSQMTLASNLMAEARSVGDLDLYAEAETVADEALRLAPTSSAAQLTKASAESARHDFEAVLLRGSDVLAESPADQGALGAVGDAHFELGQYDHAADCFRQMDGVERNASVVSRQARLAYVTGDTDQSIELSVEALERAAELPLRPGEAAFYWFQLGFHLFESGDVDGAAIALENALAIDPTHPGSTELLAHVRTSQGRTDAAVELYRAMLEGGGAADLHGALSVLYEQSGDEAAADEQLAAGLELAATTIDDYPAERRHVAGFLVDHEPTTALQLAEQDLAARRDVYSYDLMAWALLANDRADEADEMMAHALALGTRDADLYYHAGMIAEAVGDRDRASRMLRMALAINPTFDPVGAPEASVLLRELGE